MGIGIDKFFMDFKDTNLLLICNTILMKGSLVITKECEVGSRYTGQSA